MSSLSGHMNCTPLGWQAMQNMIEPTEQIFQSNLNLLISLSSCCNFELGGLANEKINASAMYSFSVHILEQL
jgi:hypothetical protein